MKVAAFAVKHGEAFCRFGSYREFVEVQSPLKATLYVRRIDADARLREDHWLNGTRVPASELTIVTITGELHDQAVT